MARQDTQRQRQAGWGLGAALALEGVTVAGSESRTPASLAAALAIPPGLRERVSFQPSGLNSRDAAAGRCGRCAPLMSGLRPGRRGAAGTRTWAGASR
jgi:hypothetical protein